jgi:hypothetical protein
MLRSPTLQRRTASALNSALNDLRFRAIWEHSYRTCVRSFVSTETGEDHRAFDGPKHYYGHLLHRR